MALALKCKYLLWGRPARYLGVTGSGRHGFEAPGGVQLLTHSEVVRALEDRGIQEANGKTPDRRESGRGPEGGRCRQAPHLTRESTRTTPASSTHPTQEVSPCHSDR